MKNRANYIMFFVVIWMVLGLITSHEVPAATEDFKVTASDAAAYDYFGFFVSVSGDVIVVGAFGDDDGGDNSGAAYVYRYNAATNMWSEEAKLRADDAAAGDHFGQAVSVSGDVIVVGAFLDDDDGYDSGSAYVFRYNGESGWLQEAKLTADDAAADDEFGHIVSVNGDVIVVGAYADEDAGFYSGSAYVFRHTEVGGWVQEAKLTASDAAEGDGFGSSVSVDGDVIAVGAYRDDDGGEASGSAYVFRYAEVGGWVQEAKLTASDAGEDHLFGLVSVSGDVIVVGALQDDHAGYSSGSAYVFRYGGSTWYEEAKLTASDAALADRFGGYVSVNGNVIVIGAANDDDAGNSSGSAYVYRYTGAGMWEEEVKLTASDAEVSNFFGQSVSMSGDVIVVGASGNDDAGNSSGSAYVFEACLLLDHEAPVLTCPGSLEAECAGPVGTAVSFDATATDNCTENPSINCIPSSGSTFPPGETVVACTAVDEVGNTGGCEFSVTVKDTTKPIITSLSATPDILWPPNHRMVPVTVNIVSTDSCDTEPSCRIASVESNEPENGQGDGNTSPDWQITDDLTVDLRAERSGRGSGRNYTITVECTDAAENSTTESVEVTVPHSKGKKSKDKK